MGAAMLIGCSTQGHRESAERAGYAIIEEKQQEALGRTEEFTIGVAARELRQRLIMDQNLTHSAAASLGVQYLEETEHWPKDNYLDRFEEYTASRSVDASEPYVLTLTNALQIAARNNRDYQGRKEGVFRTALQLYLERDEFRATLGAIIGGEYNQDRSAGTVTESVSGGASAGVTQRLKRGGDVVFNLGWDIVELLRGGGNDGTGAFADTSITLPLLRGSGRHIVTEPLQQAERDMVYALYDFEEFKRGFSVDIASEYFSVLQRQNEVRNAAENYRGLVASTRRARRLLDAGNLPAIQVDQSIQDELSARNRWVSARASYDSALDGFKVQLGLPTDARIELDNSAFDQLSADVANVLQGATAIEYEEEIPPADAEVVLEEPTPEGAGPLEVEYDYAIRLAFENRLDLRRAIGEVYDAQRGIVLAADRLRGEVTLFGGARVDGDSFDDFDLDSGNYNALLNIDLPLERTAEAAAYRTSYIALEQAVRGVQQLEDSIKLQVLNQLRDLSEARESLRIQALSVELANRRVRGANLNLRAGRVEIRDLLDAQDDLLSAQNSLTAATVNYRVAELELQQTLGVLEVGPDGLWREFTPEQPTHETATNTHLDPAG